MKHTKRKYILQTVAVVSVLATLLVSMNGCKKKKPDTTESSSTAETTTETTGNTENTKPTQMTKPTQSTNPSEGTNPTEGTTGASCEHVLGNWIVDETANCTKEGSRHKACTICKETVVTEAIAKTAHTASGWLGEKATCTKESTQYQQCTQCDEKLVSIVVDKADHKTYQVKGQGYTVGYRCSICHETIQEQYEIPAAGSVPYTIRDTGSTCTITGLGNWTGSELILPATINGRTVTAIDANAFANFANRTSIKTVYIPKTVTEIGDKAFSGCSALTKIVYEGTANQWTTSVAKGAQWNNNTGSYQIHCNNRILSK